MGWASSSVAVTLLLVVVSASGCVEDVQDDPTGAIEAPPGSLGPLDLQWGLTECKAAVAIIGVEASKVAPYVPKGFAIMSAAQIVAQEGGAPLMPPNPALDGNLGIEMFTCQAGIGLNETMKNIVYGSLFTAVIPTAELRVDGVKHHFVKWDVLIPDEDRRERLVAAGVPAVDGEATFPVWVPASDSYAFEGSMKLGNDTYGFMGEGGVPAQDGSFVEFTQTPDGLVFWKTEYKSSGLRVGPIDVTVPATGLAAKILGAGTYHASGFLGEIAFENGSITDTKPE